MIALLPQDEQCTAAFAETFTHTASPFLATQQEPPHAKQLCDNLSRPAKVRNQKQSPVNQASCDPQMKQTTQANFKLNTPQLSSVTEKKKKLSFVNPASGKTQTQDSLTQ